MRRPPRPRRRVLPTLPNPCGSWFGAEARAGFVSVGVLLASGLLTSSEALAQAAAPAATPRIPANALPQGHRQTSGTPITYTSTGSVGTIKQTDSTNIVSWKSFDIGANAALTIKQPSATAVLLNKVDGGAFQNKSVIEGVLNANGRVYLYNPNGIIFGKTATVDVNTLIASSLKFDEARVEGGLLRPGDGPVLGADPALGRRPGAVVIEGDGERGAQIRAATGGLVLMAAPDVSNAGSLQAKDGQVILAAGSKVYLAAPRVNETGTSLRGLLVEVGNSYPIGTADAPTGVGTSTAENTETGRIDVGRGNATMIGYAVNQKGLVSAQTSVSLNGSIYLLARDQAEPRVVSGGTSYVAARSGQLVLGPGSLTEVKVDGGEKDTVSAITAYTPSQVVLNGQNIQLQESARIVAPGAAVSLRAERLVSAAESAPAIDPRQDTVRVDLAPGSLIDVSGSRDAVKPMQSNVIEVDLRGTELADNVLLRESPLYGSKVSVDIRKGTAVADISGWLDQRQLGVGELNAKGGTVNLSAESSIIQRPGSRINVNGGWVDFQAGHVNTSQLVLGTSSVDIAAAKAGVAYSAVAKLPDSDANFEAGYRQGASAGTVAFSAPIVVMQGELSGQAQRGVYQRDPAVSGYPQGGRLQVGNVSSSTIDSSTGRAVIEQAGRFGYEGLVRIGSGLSLAAQAPQVGAAFDAGNSGHALLASQLTIDTEALGRAGFSRFDALTMGNIDVEKPVNLAAGGQLRLGAATRNFVRDGESGIPAGGHVAVHANVAAPGGLIVASAESIAVASGVQLDAAGRWTNDAAAAQPSRDAAGLPADAVARKGGSVDLVANTVQLGEEVGIDVSAGAWLNAKGGLTQGAAGTVTLEARPLDGFSIESIRNASLSWGQGLKLAGNGFGAGGGSLRLRARNVNVGSIPSSQSGSGVGDLDLATDFFQQGGFTSYDVAANLNLNVVAGTQLRPRALQWALPSDASLRSSGRMQGLASTALYELAASGATRASTSLSLSAATNINAAAGRLLLADTAKIDLDPAAALSLVAGTQLDVEGDINAPAGRVVLGLSAQGSVQDRILWLGTKASVRADGSTARLYTDASGISSGNILGAGSIWIGQPGAKRSDGLQTLQPASGHVVITSGALLSVAGVNAGDRTFSSNGVLSRVTSLESAGGSIDARAGQSLVALGSFSGKAGGTTAKGGSISLALEADDAVLDLVSSVITLRLATYKYKLDQGIGGFTPTAGTGIVQVGSLKSSNFDSVRLRSAGALGFDLNNGSQTLTARTSLSLDAPTLLSDSRTRAAAYADLVAAEVKNLRDQGKGVGLTLEQLQELAAPTAQAQLIAQGFRLDEAATLTVNAPFVQLGNTAADQINYPSAGQPPPRSSMAGNAQLTVKADNIDLIGHTATQGFGTAGLTATQDIRLAGITYTDSAGRADGTQRGSWWMKGDLALTASQVYPTTLSDYRFAIAPQDGAAGTLSFGYNGQAQTPILSAAGSIQAAAAHIVQGGRLYAPLGQIELGNVESSIDAILTADLSYTASSITSVAGNGTVPLGQVSNGSVPTASRWSALLSDGSEVVLTQSPNPDAVTPERALPAKAIVSRGGKVSVDRQATLDLSGGGTAYAFGFTPGRGGSVDVLAKPDNAPNTTTFAILPGFSGKLSPKDGTYGVDGGLAAGDAIWLSGLGDLKAGLYTLLPAHYALMPGAYSVSIDARVRDMPASANAMLTDGSMLVSGSVAQAGSGVVGARQQGFVVSPSSVVKRKSEFAIYDANDYFAAKAQAAGSPVPERPADGGRLVMDVRGRSDNDLAFDGSFKLGAASGGRAGSADISAPAIEVLSSVGGGSAAGVKLQADQLNALHADTLVLGGIRQSSADGSSLLVGANSVALDNDAAHALRGAELILAATDKLSLGRGASLVADQAPARASADITVTGKGALLRASGGAAVEVQRQGSKLDDGVLELAQGSSVTAAGSAYLDGAQRVTLDGSVHLGAGGSLGFGAPVINLGSYFPQALLDAPTSTRGLMLGNDSLQLLSGSLSSLSFNSYGQTIGLYGNPVLGGTGMDLSIRSAGLQAHGGSTAIYARQLRLEGVATAKSVAASDTGVLSVQAERVVMGSGTFGLRGFGDVAFSAQDAFVAGGKGGVLSAERNLTLAARVMGTVAGGDALVAAGADLRLSQLGAAPSEASADLSLGGALGFSGRNISSDASVLAPAGRIEMAATDAIVLRGGSLSVAGQARWLGGHAAYAPAGFISLQAPNVRLTAAATLDVSAVAADAGRLSIEASNSVQLEGRLKGASLADASGTVGTQGQFSLVAADTANIASFGGLNAQLNEAGFGGSRSFRFLQGDVVLTGSDRIAAQQVVIATDNGNLSLSGSAVIDASGDKGGSIELYAAQANAAGNAGRVSLVGGAKLLAIGHDEAAGEAGSAGRGGRVVIGSGNADGSLAASVNAGASINLDGGLIDVSGVNDAKGGSVLLRAPRVSGGRDLAIASLKTSIAGSAQTVLEGVQFYQGSTISDSADSATNLNAGRNGQMYRDASRLAARSSNILRRLGSSAAQLRAGVEVRSLDSDASGQLTVSVNEFASNAADRGWNLNDWRFNGAPVNLSLRAKGDLRVVGSISDGFVKPTDAAQQGYALPNWALATDLSADIRLVGGANLSSALPTAVRSGAGDVRIDFADRTPNPGAGHTMKVAGTTQTVTANPLAPVTNTDAPVALVRTGTGRIDVAAGRDVSLGLAKFYVSADKDESFENPILFDGRTGSSNEIFKVSLYGASLYTAGRAVAGEVLPFAAPSNALNTHFGAAANAQRTAVFARDGGGISVTAGRDVNGPQSLAANWSMRLADGTPGDPGDSTARPPVPATAAVPGTSVALPRVVPQLVNNWLFRQGRSSTNAAGDTVFETLADGKTTVNTAWWTRTDYFSQGFATLGGGDVRLAAEGQVSNVSVSAASNAFAPKAGAALVERGGGDISVLAGGDIAGGVFYVQKGQATLRAEGAITTGLLEPAAKLGTGQGLGPVLALGDAQAQLTAAGALTLGTVYNPTLTEQSQNNLNNSQGAFPPTYVAGQGWDASYSGGQAFRKQYAQYSGFSTYGAESGVQLAALGGEVRIAADATGLATAGGWEIANRLDQLDSTAGFARLYGVMAPSLRAVAFGGDVLTDNGFALAPSASGQLALLASGSVKLETGRGLAIRMLDNDPALMSTAMAPRVMSRADLGVLSGISAALETHTRGGLHAQDASPVVIAADKGDVQGDADAKISLSVPKALQVSAGRDVIDFGFSVQHLREADVSSLSAGRDVIDTTQARGSSGSPSDVAHLLSGPGRLDIQAGRNVDLGNGGGYVTRGNLDNAYLPEGGASLRVIAGRTGAPDYAGFVERLGAYGSVYDLSIEPLLSAAPDLTQTLSAAQLRDIARQLQRVGRALPADPAAPGAAAAYAELLKTDRADLVALQAFVRAAKPDLPETTKPEGYWALLRGLSAADQARFLSQNPEAAQRLQARATERDVALRLALAAKQPAALDHAFFVSLIETSNAKDLKPFDALIASLFPNAAAAKGDISNFGSQFKTEQGGGITLLAPSGSVFAGLTLGYSLKPASQQGIFTIRGGEIQALVDKDFLVNKGRVFTLGGGDISLVSQNGDIDAGKGSKTASSAPPPLVTVDANGSVKVDVSSSIAGSGIATLKTRADVPAGDVLPSAPRGVFDAGDAGVRSSGSVKVVAVTVLNANNISAAGAVSGASVAVAAPSLGSIAPPANAAPRDDEVGKAAAGSAAGERTLPLTVDALGFGPEPAAEDEDEETRKKKKK